MVGFFEKGYAIVELFDPKLALEVWKDMDKDEIRRLRDEAKSDKPKKPLTVPKTASFSRFVQEIDNNMIKCWERYGKRHLEPPVLRQYGLNVWGSAQPNSKKPPISIEKEHIWILVPVIALLALQGPKLIEGSHLKPNCKDNKFYNPTVPPGSALMFHGRIQWRDSAEGGGVVFIRVYDVTGL